MRRTSQMGPQSIAVYLRVPRFFGLLGSRLAQIGYLDAKVATVMSKLGLGECQRRLKSDPLSILIAEVNLTHPGTLCYSGSAA